jgi:hypothetical protein
VVAVLASRPYAPVLVSILARRWQVYASTLAYEVGGGDTPPRLSPTAPRGRAFCTNHIVAWYGRVVVQTLRRLDLVCYQSAELVAKAAEILGTSPAYLASTRHIVLPRGVLSPPALPRQQMRRQILQELGLTDAHVIVGSLGRGLVTDNYLGNA